MTNLRISLAAGVLGVSDDTMRRWIDSGRIEASLDSAGKHVVDGPSLARFAQDQAANSSLERFDAGAGRRSARNHLTGLVTRIVSDKVMSQVELQCGAYRIVSLISTEAVNELQLEVGAIATAVIKATNVTIESRS